MSATDETIVPLRPTGRFRRTAKESARSRRVRVLAADSNPLYRDALVRAIKQRPALELVADASDGREALLEIDRERPDVAVVDLELHGLNGAQILNAVSRDGLPTRVVLLGFSDGSVAFRLIGAGASGYLTKDADQEQICDAISAVARGETALSPDVQTGIAGEIRSRGTDRGPLLSDRERQVLRMIAEGRSAPQIARELHLSVATVKTHLHHLYRKLEVSERAAAVAEAMRRGLLE